jgi:iron-sulfur cluster assembly protein
MLAITPEAKDLLRGIESRTDGVLRLETMDSGELGFVSGPAQAGDQVVEEGGESLLHIAAPVADRYDGHELDRVEGPQGPQFTITQPGDEFEPEGV